jgi:glycosyltransferase involved in cell wall biosynthesis
MTDAPMRVSVIVPLYNKARYIARCLDSILTQTFSRFEVIVVDDGSTDGGPTIVRDYESRDPRVRLIRQHNAGPGAARNRGGAEARGELLAPLDADDSWAPDYLAENVRLLDSHPQAAAVFRATMEMPQKVSSALGWHRAGVPPGACRIGPDTRAEFLNSIVASLGSSSAVVRKPAFDRLGGFYSANRCVFAEDTHLWVKLLLNCEAVIAYDPLVNRYCDASELALNRKEVRPIEPFLLDDRDLLANCPSEMHALLRKFLALRACKTASVYGYVGQYRRARELMRRFVGPSDWRLPWFFVALVSCTPVARRLGTLARLAGVNPRQLHA